MFLARMVFFRLHESPRYLVHAGRAQEALESLQLISRFNGEELPLDLDDVDDRPPTCDGEGAPFLSESPVEEWRQSNGDSTRAGNEVVFDADCGPHHDDMMRQSSTEFLRSEPNGIKDYHSTKGSPESLEGNLPETHGVEVQSTPDGKLNVRPANTTPDVSEFNDNVTPTPSSTEVTCVRPPQPRLSGARGGRRGSIASRRSSFYVTKRAMGRVLPRWIRRPLWAWLDRVAMVLSPEWMKTTLLMWTTWWAMSLGVFLIAHCYCYAHVWVHSSSIYNVQCLLTQTARKQLELSRSN